MAIAIATWRLTWVASAILVALMSVCAKADEWSGRDTLLVDAAAVPRLGTVRISAGGAASGSDSSGAAKSIGASILYSATPALALGLSTALESTGALNPSPSIRYQLLSQEEHGFNLAAQVRYRAVGFFSNGGELEMGLNLGRCLGEFELLANGVIGQGLGGGTGTEVQGKLSAGWRFIEAARVGIDARIRGDLVDKQRPEPQERDFDLLADRRCPGAGARSSFNSSQARRPPRHRR